MRKLNHDKAILIRNKCNSFRQCPFRGKLCRHAYHLSFLLVDCSMHELTGSATLDKKTWPSTFSETLHTIKPVYVYESSIKAQNAPKIE